MSHKSHSVTVPTQYRRMKIALKSATERKQSIKSLIYSEKHARISSMKSTLLEYCENRLVIDTAIEKSKILEENPRLCPFLCKILVTESIFRGKQLIGNSKPVETVRAYKHRLQTMLNHDPAVVKHERKQDLSSGKPFIGMKNLNSLDNLRTEPFELSCATRVFLWLTIYSILMITFPLFTYYGVKSWLKHAYALDIFYLNCFSVSASVLVVNGIICLYIRQAYYEDLNESSKQKAS